MGIGFVVILVARQTSKEWQALVPNGTDAFFHESCVSTNTLAVEYGNDGLVKPSWFIAGEQTAGRGRRGRAWTSKPGNLYASYVFKPADDTSALTPLPFIIALAVRDTLIALGCPKEQVKCKWPNDVLVNDQKVCGILIESSAVAKQNADYVVVGIGINLKHAPTDAQFPATSVASVVGSAIDSETAFKILAFSLEDRMATLANTDMPEIAKQWSAVAWGIGQRREIHTHHESFHATVIGLEGDGALKLTLDDGTLKRLYAGDVFGAATQCNEK